MFVKIADEVKMRREARLHQHIPRVATDREDLTGFNPMVPIQRQPMGAIFNRPLVDHRLPVVLTITFQISQFP